MRAVALTLSLSVNAVFQRMPWQLAADDDSGCGSACSMGGDGPAAELCCSDDKGWSCCIAQSSQCINQDASAPQYPSRCCPRYTVACDVGSVGCCDPAQPWQWQVFEEDSASRIAELGPEPVVAAAESAYVMFNEGGTLRVMSVALATGQTSSVKNVVGFEDLFGESTRPWLWDQGRAQFYYLDANFTAAGGARPAGGRDVLLYTCEPTSGAVTRATVAGAKDFPVGYAMHG
jgi:hypothetical protein